MTLLDHTTTRDHGSLEAQLRSVTGHLSIPGQLEPDNHPLCAGDGTQATRGPGSLDAQPSSAAGTSSLTDPARFDTQSASVGEGTRPDGGQKAPDAQPESAAVLDHPADHILAGTHRTGVGGVQFTEPSAIVHPDPIHDPRATRFDSGLMLLLCKTVDEMEELRKATDNRVRQMTNTKPDVDGETRGLGMDERSPQVAAARALAEGIAKLEKQAVRDLEKAMRDHPLHSFIHNTKGLGAKTVARLLAEIGDPYWNDLHDRPRTVSELWAFCGLAVHDGHAQARKRGQQSNWSDVAKKRVWVIAQTPIKVGGPYREVYDTAREKYADAVHPHACVRCGPSGKPALAGTPLSAAHQHARAIRVMCKTILRDLWIASRDIHANGGLS